MATTTTFADPAVPMTEESVALRTASMDAEVEYLLSKRVKKISFEVPSTIRKEAQAKSHSFYGEKKDTRSERQKRPVPSYIDNFTHKPYILTKPKRVLVKDRDFLHLLGEVNGTKYDYCSRPELELFVIGVEAREYYQQIHYRDLIIDESSRPRTPHRPQSAAPPQSTDEKKESDAVVAQAAEGQIEGEPLNFPQHIVGHKVQNLFYDVKSLADKKTIALLYDPLKNLLIVSEKMEIELIQMLMEMYLDQLLKVIGVAKPLLELSLPKEPISPKTPTTPGAKGGQRQSKLVKSKSKTRESLMGKGMGLGSKSNSQNPLTALPLEETTANARPITPDRQPRPSSSIRRPTSAMKHRPTTPTQLHQQQQQRDSEVESEEEAAAAANVAAIARLNSARLTKEQLEQALLLLQSYYYIGNQDVVYTMTKEKIQLWKRFYATYLLPFFFSFLDSYSFQYGLAQIALAERMHQIEHHIELNQSKSILEDSQSEASDNSVASLEKKPKKPVKRKTMAPSTLKKNNSERKNIAQAQAHAIQAAASSSEDERDGGRSGGLARRNNIKPIFIPRPDDPQEPPGSGQGKGGGKKLSLINVGKKGSTASLHSDH